MPDYDNPWDQPQDQPPPGSEPPGGPPPLPPPPVPSNPGVGACPPGTPNGPAACCPPGTVWRNDTKRCEPPDERSKNAKETCPEPPNVSCPPGQGTWCDFDTMEWKCAPNGNGGGGGGTGGGGGARAPMPAIPGAFQADTLWAEIEKRLKGTDTRYTPGVMSSLLGEVKQGAEARAGRDIESSDADLQRRGLLRSTIAAGAARDIRAGASSQVMAGRNQIMRAKIDADYQDRTQAIQAAQAWIDSLRSYVASANATAASRDAAMANITLGYARLQQEMAMLRERYQQQLQLLLLGGGF